MRTFPSRLAGLLLACLALGACTRTIARLQPILLSTDRPSFSSRASVVPVGFPQVESGLTYSRTDGASATAIGETTLRAAVSPTVELRLTAPSYVLLRESGSAADGLGDASLGAKLVLSDVPSRPGETAPSVALLLGTSLPTGAPGVGSDRALPSAALLVGWSLSPRTGLTANAIWGQAEVAGGTADVWAGVLGLGFSHTDKVGSFAEVYSSRGPSGDWDDPWVVGGLKFLMLRTVQFDVHGGVRSATPGEGYFLGLGLSRRF